MGGGGRQAWVRQEGLRTVEGQRGGDAAPHCLTTKHRLRRCRRSLEEVALLLAQGAVSVNVSHRLALEDAPEAFQVMLSRQVCGAVRCVCMRGGAEGGCCCGRGFWGVGWGAERAEGIRLLGLVGRLAPRAGAEGTCTAYLHHCKLPARCPCSALHYSTRHRQRRRRRHLTMCQVGGRGRAGGWQAGRGLLFVSLLLSSLHPCIALLHCCTAALLHFYLLQRSLRTRCWAA